VTPTPQSIITTLTTVSSLRRELKDKGEKAFREAHDCPALLLTSFPQLDEDLVEVHTLEDSQPDTRLKKKKNVGRDFLVLLAKTERNVFDSRITIGRAKNNDVVLRVRKISKLHASLALDRDGNASVTDMGSRNGTAVNGTWLDRRSPTALKSGDLLNLWRFEFQYLDREGLVNLVRSSAG